MLRRFCASWVLQGVRVQWYSWRVKIELLSKTLRKVISSRGLGGQYALFRIVGMWEDAAGGVISRHAQPVALRGKKLSVQVDSPVWMQQLSLLRPELIEKVNKGLGSELVTEMVLKLGEVRARSRQHEEPPPLPPLTESERKQLEGYVSGVDDREIRAAMLRLIEKDMRSRKSRDRKAGR